MNIEIMRNTLYKAYLDDFAAFCRRLGGATAEVMGGLLSFEVCSLPSQQCCWRERAQMCGEWVLAMGSCKANQSASSAVRRLVLCIGLFCPGM